MLKPGNGEAPSGNGITLGFAAASPAEVDAFHAVRLAVGGTCEGAPAARGHLPGACAAYLRDPAGNKVAPTPLSEMIGNGGPAPFSGPPGVRVSRPWSR